MAEAPQDGRTGEEPTEYRPHETTVHYGPEFAAQLAAMEAGIAPDELEVIAALPSASALLIVRRGPNMGARFLLDSDLTVAGLGTQFSVRDLGSLNGTFMSGDRIDQTVPLLDGAEVQVGKFHLTFYASRRDLPQSA
jgi:hypothetical protein